METVALVGRVGDSRRRAGASGAGRGCVRERDYGLRPAGWGAGESDRKPEWLTSKAGMGKPSDGRLSGGEGRVKVRIGEVGDGWGELLEEAWQWEVRGGGESG
jgi:hypothetical protein